MTNNLLTAKREKRYRATGQYFISSKGDPMMITLKDRLSHLTYREVCKLLGPEGERLIRQGGKYDLNISDPVTWGDDFFRLNLGCRAKRVKAVKGNRKLQEQLYSLDQILSTKTHSPNPDIEKIDIVNHED